MSEKNKPSSQTYENDEATKRYSFRNAELKIAVKVSSKLQKVVLKERNVSLPKLQKAVPKGAQLKFSAQKSFLRECRARYRRNIRRSVKSQREYRRNRRRRSSKDVP
jgi:gamma-glutamylcysteine synthetase